ncbi:MAG: chorismate mutase [Tepidibacter sp.]|jgi:chorismate mutase|uniref:chorismate mutase n=1 Tax=Tepidibacter sp. TaxID=2529387 RepID=UPI0025FB7AFD|nr:chorismate mutase [Tepidibacter sp.]MCT4509209.1 chorismate mutase [Tepidibacter sp.]
MRTLAIRGATTVEKNEKTCILNETKILIKKIIDMNNLNEDDIVSIIFTMTRDLDEVYPSVAVRELLNLNDIPLLNFEEKYIKNSLNKCIRVLMHVNTDIKKNKIIHIYLNEAKKLRTDLSIRSGSNE